MTSDLLERFASHELDASDVRAVEEHLASCDPCARAARARAAAELHALRAHFVERELPIAAHPDYTAALAPYARDLLDEADREVVESHLDDCAVCREKVARFRAPRKRAVQPRWLAAAAALVLVLLACFILFRPKGNEVSPSPVATTHPHVPSPPKRETAAPPAAQVASRYEDPEWDALIRDATQTGRLPIPPDLASLRGRDEVLRGEHTEEDRVRPAGVVIDDVRPTFSWPARAGSTYTVFVFDGNREIAHSAPLHETRWTADRDLPRGRVLTWQVEAASDERVETIPHPPAPMARFRITGESDHRALARVRASYPNDDLLLAVLCARAGMLADSEAALRRAARTDPAALKLLNENFRAN